MKKNESSLPDSNITVRHLTIKQAMRKFGGKLSKRDAKALTKIIFDIKKRDEEE